MKYRFNVMTNYISDIEVLISQFNIKNNTDLKFIQVINDEVTFVELESSMSNEMLFEFGVHFGAMKVKKNIEG